MYGDSPFLFLIGGIRMPTVTVFLQDMKNFSRLLGSSFNGTPTVREVLEHDEKAYVFRDDSLPESASHTELLQHVHHVLNTSHPRGYCNRSLIVGDVLCIEESGTKSYYMVDGPGFGQIS